MADIQDRLRYVRVAQHASVRRKKSQQVPEAHDPSSQEEPSTSEAHVSPHATPSSSSRRRRDSPSDASLHSSSRRRQVSPVPSITIDTIDPLPYPTVDATDLVPPPEGEADVHAKLEEFGGDPVDLSLLPLYPDHTTRHIWDKEECGPQKFLNHMRKIVVLPQSNEEWF
ncbi:uncharacterized protein LOC127105495 [Lathyrus oleraceus]|uniref:uncharacterized protein LOC127105495 n=1 Tax=Pisum sativum TaxID=3888 RepID=UPI0021D19F6D|nr:uncharacterized protein LOC127105495 [Pisum sativum]